VTTERSRHLQSEPSRRFAPLSLGDPRARPASPGRPHGRPGHCTTTSHDDGQVQADASAGPARAYASFERQAPPWADDEPVVDTAGNHTDPGHPSRAAACPPPRSTTSFRSDTADAGTHGQRTPAPDTGHRSRGHWTLDAGRGRDRVTTAPPASGPPRLTSRVTALGRPTVFLWTAPAALGSPCRLGVRPPPSPRLPLALPRSSSVVAPPAPSGASAHCSPRTIAGRG
jgi:hypothetical protein